MLVINRLDGWFEERLKRLQRANEIRAYVAGVLSSKELVTWEGSVVLAYASAVERPEFSSFQKIGDWALWFGTFVRDDEVVQHFGSKSYATCHRMLYGKWPLYEELAHDLSGIVKETRLAVNVRL